MDSDHEEGKTTPAVVEVKDVVSSGTGSKLFSAAPNDKLRPVSGGVLGATQLPTQPPSAPSPPTLLVSRLRTSLISSNPLLLLLLLVLLLLLLLPALPEDALRPFTRAIDCCIELVAPHDVAANAGELECWCHRRQKGEEELTSSIGCAVGPVAEVGLVEVIVVAASLFKLMHADLQRFNFGPSPKPFGW